MGRTPTGGERGNGLHVAAVGRERGAHDRRAPGQTILNVLVQTDALANLRAEQERIAQELEVATGEAHSIKGQHHRRQSPCNK